MFSISTSNLPRIRSYAEALAQWEQITPIRGRGEDIRPLERSRNDAKRVILNADKSVALRLHRTDVVAYFPDGSVVVRSYDSRSTVLFAGRLLPSNLLAINHRGHMWVGVRRDNGAVRYYREHREPLRFVVDPEDVRYYKLADDCTPATITRRVVDKEIAKSVRARLAPFKAWAQATLALSGGHYVVQRSAFYGKTTAHNVLDEMVDKLDDPELYANLISCGRSTAYGVVDASALAKIDKWALVWGGAYKHIEVPVSELPKPDTI